MDPRAPLLKSSFEIAHMVFNAVVFDLDERMGRHSAPGATIPTPAAIMAHALYSQDMMVNEHVRQQPTVLQMGGFAAKTGLAAPEPSMSPAFLSQVFDVDALREYAAALFAQTAAFLESPPPGDLDRVITTPLGSPMNAATYLASFGLVHLAQHTGEISAVKGVLGVKGLPF